MANAIYPKAREAFLTGGIDWASDTIKLLLVDATYTYSDTDQFVDDVGGGAITATSDAFTGKTTTGGVADADDVLVAAVSGDEVTSVIVFKDTGSTATSPLILFLDTKSNSSPVDVVPTGADVSIPWSNGSDKIFKL